MHLYSDFKTLLRKSMLKSYCEVNLNNLSMNTIFLNTKLSFPGQDSLVLQTLDQASCAITAAGHQASSWNTNGTKRSPYEVGHFFLPDKGGS